MKKLCHHDRPTEASDDVGAEIRERAAQSTGFRMGQDVFDARRELERNGGAEGVIRSAVKRIERGQ